MNYTTNYSYKLPEPSDYINVQDLDDNFTAIDATLYTVEDLAGRNEGRLDNLTTYVPISQQTIASSGAVDVILSGVTWGDWREVVIWVEGLTASSTNDSITVGLNAAYSGGALAAAQYCWYYVPTGGGAVTRSGAAGMASLHLNMDAGGSGIYSKGGVTRITLFPSKNGGSYVRVKMDGPVNSSDGGSNTVTYNSLTKIVLSGGTAPDYTGATIRVMGVN